MKRAKVFLCLLAFSVVTLSLGWAQTAAPAKAPAPMAPAPAVATHVPSYSDVYCAGFITNQPVQTGLFVVGSSEGGMKYKYSDRDIIYLSRGAGYVVNPGGEYMLLRAVKDPIKQEVFTGQNALLQGLGKMYAEVGRIKVNIVHEASVTAVVEKACQEIQPGDVAIPFNQKPMPQFQTDAFDRFAPPSGKNPGIIVTAKDYTRLVGAGTVVYLSMDAPEGISVGQTYRIFRTPVNSTKDPNSRYLENVPTHMNGMRQSYRLTPEQRKALPRDILGQLVILWAEGRSAVGLVTISRAEIFSGDQVELK